MATIKTRYRADRTATYRVVWKAGDTLEGVWESATFARKADAARFRRDVDLDGQRWPDGWVKGPPGSGGGRRLVIARPPERRPAAVPAAGRRGAVVRSGSRRRP